MNGGPRLARGAAVLLLSAATLAFEILIVRVFAIEYFHHFAYMAIGVAMLGFGASGTLLALAGRLEPATAARWFAPAAAATALALVASPALVHRIPLEPTQLVWDAAQWPRLGLVYLLVALPFAAGALAVLLALAAEPTRPGRIYGASFLGSGLGAVLAVAVLGWLFPVRALAVPAALAALGAVVASSEPRRSAWAAGLSWAALLVAVASLIQPPWAIRMSPFKSLPQVEAYPGARRVAERTSPVGWVVAVDAPAFHYAPGLSLAFTGELPRQTALFLDGQITGAVSRVQPDSAVHPSGRESAVRPAEPDSAVNAYLDWLPSSLPYALGGREHVLVIGAGGATDIAAALAHGARRTTAVELDPDLVRLGRQQAFPRAREGGEVRWVVGDAMSFVARTREQFDLVTLGPGGAFGTSAAGVHALDEDFLRTVEAHVRYLRLLSGRGVLAVTCWLTVPPRESVRMILTAGEALRRVRPDALRSGLVVAHGWGTATVLVRPSGFTAAETERLARWAGSRRFDLDWCGGAPAAPSVPAELTAPSAPAAQDMPAAPTAYNALGDSALAQAAAAVVAEGEAAEQFASRYVFEVAPADDARPYPHRFLRARSLAAFLRSGRGTWLPFAEWGYIALVATLVQSALLAGLLLLIAAAALVRIRGPGRARSRRIGAPGVYFATIGFGYLAAEMAAIQQLGLLLGHPVYAVAAVLAAMLVFSGVGSVLSDGLNASAGRRVGFVLAVLTALFGAALLALVHLLQPAPLPLRAGAAILALAPLALLMGMPFPAGLRIFAVDAPGLAWAWATNGFASVVAAPLAAIIALEAGSPTLWLVGAAAYAVAAVILWRGGVRAPAAATSGGS